ncbi:hypothetical protein CK203_042165 [Vitis vinifera]|uniref:Uncharacterized protein n=1 Tax=Vitis vinifera TaxID=29760 RepID=A0A438HQ01_VITVI|nr:hypothetical protein CK203_042165 [Vitis vinifera]
MSVTKKFLEVPLSTILFKLFRESWCRVGLAIEEEKLALLEGHKVARGLGVRNQLISIFTPRRKEPKDDQLP